MWAGEIQALLELREGRGDKVLGSMQVAVTGELGEGLGIWVLVSKTVELLWWLLDRRRRPEFGAQGLSLWFVTARDTLHKGEWAFCTFLAPQGKWGGDSGLGLCKRSHGHESGTWLSRNRRYRSSWEVMVGKRVWVWSLSFERSSESCKLLLLLALRIVASVHQSSATPVLCMQNGRAAFSRAVLGVC